VESPLGNEAASRTPSCARVQPKKRPSRLTLVFWTLRYLALAQIWSRTARIVRRRWWSIICKPTLANQVVDLRTSDSMLVGLGLLPENGPWAAGRDETVARARQVADSDFLFLRHRIQYPAGILWDDPLQSQLWRYHLHYFSYVQDLLVWAACEPRERLQAFAAFKDLTSSWIKAHPSICGDGWHPYTISLRLVNWLEAMAEFRAELKQDREFCSTLLRSIHGQAAVLHRDLELDVRGNHLIENLRALIWVGVLSRAHESEHWLGSALSRLRDEVLEQVKTDGGHFERCPGYHLVVLKDLLEIACRLRASGHAAPEWLDSALRSMVDYLLAILPPDGTVPLLKDTAVDAAPTASAVLTAAALYFDDARYKISGKFELFPALLFGKAGWNRFLQWEVNAQARPSTALPASGHFVFRDDLRQEYAIFDAGEACPDYLPAHAHADLFTYELSIDGRRIIVDSGVYEYAAGPWRDFFRSTRAHNTVEVDGANQSEVWGSFRVARRTRPEGVQWREGERFFWVQGQHRGCKQRKTTHRRTFAAAGEGLWIVLDELFGHGVCTARSYIHLHPALTVRPHQGGSLQISGIPEEVWITPFGHDRIEQSRGVLEPRYQGWFSERFGEVIPNTVLSLRCESEPPFCFGYVIGRGAPALVRASLSEGNMFCFLDICASGQNIRLSSDPAQPVSRA
jgi:uncharacterized heparinase superfamily protein